LPAALFAGALALLFLLPRAAVAQPFGPYLGLVGGATHGYVRVPPTAIQNPTNFFTFEAWVRIDTPDGCRSIAGKNYLQAWWVGVCGTTLRTYLKGGGSSKDGGVVPEDTWTHVAVTFDGNFRRHYVNGELVGTFAETGPLTTSTSELRIGSDVSWERTPDGRIEEVRIWNVARTAAQIRANLNVQITTAQPGLVSVYPFKDTAQDVISDRDGAIQGSGVTYVNLADGGNCGSTTATTLCLQNRFQVSATFRTGAPGTAEGTARTVNAANPGSGLFWFFSSDNWEVMVKAINGCGLNNRKWIFSAATTNVFYRLEVYDRLGGEQKIYFNYPGPPAPAVTDTSAIATCP
jgi:hypothetical protein